MVISPSHQACMLLSLRSHNNGSAKICAEQATTSSRRTGRLTALARHPSHPRHCSQLLHHSRLLPPVLDVIAISAARQQTSARCVCCPHAFLRKLHHTRILLPSPVSPDQRLRGMPAAFAGCLRNGRPFLEPYPTRPGLVLAQPSQRAAFRCALLTGSLQALASIFYTASMHHFNGTMAASVGSVSHLRLVIRPWAHVAHPGPDAISAGSRPLNAFIPEHSRQPLLMAGAPLAPPNLAAGSRS
jgi:hypothetical protein